MVQRPESGSARTGRLLVCLGWGILVSTWTTGLVGCNSTQKQHVGDPLVGEFLPKGPNGEPMAPASPPTKQTSATKQSATTHSGTTPQPTPPQSPVGSIASNTNASMANNTSVAWGKPLNIPQQNQPNWTLTNNPKSGGPTVVPVPRDNATAPSILVPAGGTTGGKVENAAPGPFPAAMVSQGADPQVAELEKALKGRGAFNVRTTPAPGGVQASCLVSQFNNPSNLRFFEATAADAPSALRALLQQIQ